MTILDTHTAIVGASGAGKTVTAKGHVEELLRDSRHLCVLDPTGAWYGLRSNAAGDGPGFDIPIFGGTHGDVAVTADQGEAIGKIVAGGVSAIVDISELRTGSEQRRFVRDLARALRAKPDGHFHFVVDEADEFAAQKPRDDYGFQVGEELIWMAKRGRLAGFVLTLITQRPASIDKEVLTQAQTLIVHQLVAPVDQKPILDYLKEHADRETLSAIRGSLASLGRGERWVYSPRAGVLERGISPMPATFDSSRTPGPGERAVEPKMLAEIDLGAIREALAPPVAEESTKNGAQNIPGNIPDSLRDWATADLIDELEQRDPEWLKSHDEFQAAVKDRDAFQAKAEYLDDRVKAAIRALGVRPIDEIGRELDDKRWAEGLKPATPSPVASPAPEKPKRRTIAIGIGSQDVGPRQARDLPAAAGKMLDMLDRMAPARVSWASLAGICGYKPRGGNFNSARKAMRESGRLIEEGDWVRSVSAAKSGMTREAARQLWKEVLLNPAPEMIDALDSRPMTRQELGDFLGKAARGGHFNNGVAQLIRNGVAIEVAGRLQLADPLPGESR